MITKKIKYVDFNGTEREEEFLFNINKTEMYKFAKSVPGGMQKFLTDMVVAKDVFGMADMFQEIVLLAYGIKSDDGKRFMKSEEISRSFAESNAFEAFMDEILSNDNMAEQFIKDLLPNLDK